MERVRAMIGISFYLYEVGSARAPKSFPVTVIFLVKEQRKVVSNKSSSQVK